MKSFGDGGCRLRERYLDRLCVDGTHEDVDGSLRLKLRSLDASRKRPIVPARSSRDSSCEGIKVTYEVGQLLRQPIMEIAGDSLSFIHNCGSRMSLFQYDQISRIKTKKENAHRSIAERRHQREHLESTEMGAKSNLDEKTRRESQR